MTDTWTTKVDALSTLVAGLETVKGDSVRVHFAEAGADPYLHVTITRSFQAFTVSGWNGPTGTASGFQYTQAFGDHQVADILKQIREQVRTSRSS